VHRGSPYGSRSWLQDSMACHLTGSGHTRHLRVSIYSLHDETVRTRVGRPWPSRTATSSTRPLFGPRLSSCSSNPAGVRTRGSSLPCRARGRAQTATERTATAGDREARSVVEVFDAADVGCRERLPRPRSNPCRSVQQTRSERDRSCVPLWVHMLSDSPGCVHLETRVGMYCE
jgi:hypothetical protein